MSFCKYLQIILFITLKMERPKYVYFVKSVATCLKNFVTFFKITFLCTKIENMVLDARSCSLDTR